ncbi:MAG: hypothetical protein Kow0025_24430 [Thermodesulfovibrionales bacterium]
MGCMDDGLVDRGSLEAHFRSVFKGARLVEVKALGKGIHGAGFLVTFDTEKGRKTCVLKGITPEGLGHDYPADRAGMLIHAFDSFGLFPSHVRAYDVLALQEDGSLKPIGGARDYYLLMETAEGTSYFADLEAMAARARLEAEDREKIAVMAGYLAGIHAEKKDSRTLYLRKLRDIVGHGECLMGVFDAYPEGVLDYREMAEIEKRCVDWRAALKGRHHRLSKIHGDFHPGNIWFRPGAGDLAGRLCLLDASRGPWGDPADDVTALTINYVFYSITRLGSITGAYLEALGLFFRGYLEKTGDGELLEVLGPYYAFRGAVVANPVFYPGVSRDRREMIFRFVRGVLETERFEPERAAEYI